jgi:MerR family transcriptional regulator, copper efflux regulator
MPAPAAQAGISGPAGIDASRAARPGPPQGRASELTFELARRLTVAPMTDLLISQLAERTGAPATTLRFYESAGLLPAGRTPGGYRVYDEDAVERLAFITAAKRLGLPLEEIAELLSVWADGTCAQVRDALRPRLAARIAEAGQRASELAAFTATLYRAREHLDVLPGQDGRCGPQCGFLPLPDPGSRPVTPDRTRQDAGDEAWRDTPIACSLGGPAASERIRQWQDLLAGAGREPIPDGIKLTMPADRAAEVAGLAAAEQHCCPFFDFRLRLTGQQLHPEVPPRRSREHAGRAAHRSSLTDPRGPSSGRRRWARCAAWRTGAAPSPGSSPRRTAAQTPAPRGGTGVMLRRAAVARFGAWPGWPARWSSGLP